MKLKVGVDNLDHLVSVLTCRRKINRWPMTIFFNMIDVGTVAAFIIWLGNNPDWEQKSPRRRRRKFVIELGQLLVSEMINERLENFSSQRHQVKEAIKLLGYIIPSQTSAGSASCATQGRCHLCPRAMDKKVRKRCSTCSSFVCPDHSVVSVLCEDCQ